MSPEFVGKTKDNKTKVSPDLNSKAVEEPVDEAQTVLDILNIDARNGYEKDAIENPTATITFLEQKRTTDLLCMLNATNFPLRETLSLHTIT